MPEAHGTSSTWSRIMWPLATAVLGAAVGIDYQRWYALGAGGAPHNVLGWAQVTYLRTKKRETTSTDMYAARIGEPHDQQWLADLPRRDGPRPFVPPYPIPQRQTNQPGDLRARLEALRLFEAQVVGGTDVRYAPSYFERRNSAISRTTLDDAHVVAREAHGEIAHIHPSDGSMHMIFSPSDAGMVLEKGWGERHSLAGVARGLPETYVFVYAPRTLQEATVVGRLVEAAVRYNCQPATASSTPHQGF